MSSGYFEAQPRKEIRQSNNPTQCNLKRAILTSLLRLSALVMHYAVPLRDPKVNNLCVIDQHQIQALDATRSWRNFEFTHCELSW